ncbi:phosphotransacetylase [Fodinibius salinus]|uniref:phosphate acetyltransferase n=1 Tax=Fodinibius salinus TaxID=860790 RepID=A0A5D3YQE7_9BACT|nr:phosphate acetyltransferase [Fodinibius salinus]TYP95203.1 phosphotransacetylase [Fodinibius salinus]
MESIIEDIRNRASEKGKTIVFPETDDPRILQAACHLVTQDICDVILIGDEKEVNKKAKEEKVKLPAAIQYHSTAEVTEEMVTHLYNRRKHKEISRYEAEQKLSQDSLYFGAALVAVGVADGCVAGSLATTGEVIRAAIHNIGLREGTDIVSSTFLMALKDGQVLTYADCGVVPYPDEKELADIAIESARTHRLLMQEEATVAMLSFSTKGSAKHEKTQLVTNALEKVQKKAPELQIDGELQFDAAFVPEVAKRKAPESNVAGKANTFIFPNLDAGNIAYKITERLAGASATGPILQGLAHPMMDLSRGCSWQDIVNASCVAILFAGQTS